MKKIQQVSVGVDVGKDFLDVALCPSNDCFRVANTSSGFRIFIQKLSNYEITQIVCESTGGYDRNMRKALEKAGYQVWCVEPHRIRSFARSEGIRAKNDSIDAKVIARFAQEKQRPYSHTKKTQLVEEIQILVRYRNELVKMHGSEKRRLKNPVLEACKKYIQHHMDYLQKNIEKLDKRIDFLIEQDAELEEKRVLMTSVPGVGKVLAATLIAEVGELGKITNKQAAALIGVAPYVQQSGNFKGYAHIGGGRPLPRHVLYNVALIAKRCNPCFKKFATRLKDAGKSPKVVLVAVMRKIITVLNAMLAKGTLWSYREKKAASTTSTSG